MFFFYLKMKDKPMYILVCTKLNKRKNQTCMATENNRKFYQFHPSYLSYNGDMENITIVLFLKATE